MAIYGAGSKWEEVEKCQDFFAQEKFILGWNDEHAHDLYAAITTLKIGDIIYLKSNAPGSRKIRVKGIGVVTKNFIQNITGGEYTNLSVKDWDSLFVKVKWICQKEFHITIPKNDGKLTNVRAASFYEEYLPFVQEKILSQLFLIEIN